MSKEQYQYIGGNRFYVKRKKKPALTPRQEKHIAKMIDKHLCFTNGWGISDTSYTNECKELSRKINKYLSR